MLDLTFGEQVKIILSRGGMIKELAEVHEAYREEDVPPESDAERLGRIIFLQERGYARVPDPWLPVPFEYS